MTAVETSLYKKAQVFTTNFLSAVFTFFRSGNSVTILEVSTGQVFYYLLFFFSRIISISTVLAMKPRTSCPTISLNMSYSFFSSVFYYFINTSILLSMFCVCRHVCYRAYVVVSTPTMWIPPGDWIQSSGLAEGTFIHWAILLGSTFAFKKEKLFSKKALKLEQRSFHFLGY